MKARKKKKKKTKKKKKQQPGRRRGRSNSYHLDYIVGAAGNLQFHSAPSHAP